MNNLKTAGSRRTLPAVFDSRGQPGVIIARIGEFLQGNALYFSFPFCMLKLYNSDFVHAGMKGCPAGAEAELLI